MPKNVLNIAAGLLPIVASDLNADEVVNYDPLTGLANADEGGRAVVSHLMVLSQAMGDIRYARRQAEVDSVYPNGSVDLVLAVSPFGFKLISRWVADKVRVGGHVLVIGNKSNKHVKQDAHLFDPVTLADSFVEDGKDGAFSLPWINTVADLVRQNVKSFKTDPASGGTTLDLVRIFERIPELV